MRSSGACLILFLAATLPATPSVGADVTVMTEDYPPFNFEANGKIVGSATERVVALFQQAGVSYTLNLQPWQRAYNTALTQPGACVYSTARTEERERAFKWVGPLVVSRWTFFARADSTIAATQLEDVRNFRIGSYQGDAIASFLAKKAFAMDTALNDELNLRKLEAGRIDLWATGHETGLFLANRANIAVKPVLDFNQLELDLACNLAMPDAMIAKLNRALAELGPAGAPKP
jgi:polar amino acid transport system substrate-binding protein